MNVVTHESQVYRCTDYGQYACVCGYLCVFVCMYALRIVSPDKSQDFTLYYYLSLHYRFSESKPYARIKYNSPSLCFGVQLLLVLSTFLIVSRSTHLPGNFDLL